MRNANTAAMPSWMHRALARISATLCFLAAGMLPALLAAQPAAAADGPDADQIARGKYLARMGDCVSCHSSTQGGDYGGGLRINTPFGFLISPNITFDLSTGIGTWTKDDLWNALHSGLKKNGEYLYPVMPYSFFTKVTRADSDAIYDFLSSVPQQVYPVDVNHLDFPFSIRATMLAWNELFFSPGTYVPDPKQSEAWNRGAYIVEGLGHCGACHDPRNSMGAVETSERLTGGRVGDWFATNLTANRQTGLGSWSDDEVVNFLKKGQNARMVAEGPMAEVVHNSLRYLTEDDLMAVAVYLKSVAAEASSVSVAAPVSFARTAAATLFVNNCGQCHGPQGAGRPAATGGGPPLRGNALVVAPDPANVVRATVGGLAGHFGRFPMSSQLNGVTAQQLADIINYVRTSWGNDAPPNVTPAMIFAMQAKTAPQ
jgi:mono/diheme cytochrome c family protein